MGRPSTVPAWWPFRWAAPAASMFALACGAGSEPTPMDPVDTTAPSVTLAATHSAVTEETSVTLTATTSDNVGVTSVEFKDDGVVLETLAAEPFELTVTLTAAENGGHEYTATARDAAGNQSTSDPATVAVAILNLPVLDTFDDNQTDSTQWSFAVVGGVTYEEVNERLELTIPAVITGPDAYGALRLRCGIAGDFDIQVDYELLTWSAQAGVRSGISTDLGAMGRHSFASFEYNGAESYVSDQSPGAGRILYQATSDVTGALRVTRVGNTVTDYYWDGVDWSALQSTTASTATVNRIDLALWTHSSLFNNQETRIAFDNFRINSGQPSC